MKVPDNEYQQGKTITLIDDLEKINNAIYKGNPKGLSC